MKISILSLVLLIAGILTVTCEVNNPTKAPFCNLTCPSEYDSICAANGKCLKVFNNACLLEAYNCRGPFDKTFREVDFSYCNDLKYKFCF